MKKLIVTLFAVGLVALLAAQTTEQFNAYINGLPTASPLGSSDQFYVRQAGTSKQVPFTGLQSAIGGITALTGDVAASGTGSVTATIQPGVVTGSKIAAGTITPGNFPTQSAHAFFVGPASGGAVTPSWRAMVGADLPFPTTSTLGGVEAITCGGALFINGISTAGVPSCATPSGGGGGGGANYTYQTANFSAVNQTTYLVDTSGGALTITLPASPSVGQWNELFDAQGTWQTANVTLNRNGSNIDSVASNLALSVTNSTVTVVYINSTIGWKVFTR